MKARLTISILLAILTIAFVFNENTKQTNPPQPTYGDEFMIGAFNSGLEPDFNYAPDTLGFNLWHIYNESDSWGGRTYPKGWWRIGAPGDTLFADAGAYVRDVQTIMGRIKDHNMTALMQRPKVEWLCYGQRSDYQCEPVSSGDLWFYSFNDHNTGIPDTDSGQGVVHCRALGDGPNHDNPGFVVKRLKANTEQCNNSSGGDAYRWDSQSDWLIKPRIRIDSNFAHNNQNASICRVIALNQEQDTIKNLILKGRHFLKEIGGQYFYNGQYLEEFFYLPNDSTLAIHGAWGDWWMHSARGNAPNDSNCNRADIQVYWYGECDMWLDYVRVDNDVADQLFKGAFETQQNNWLLWEARDIACHNNGAASYRFYIELFEFNNIPCMSYVSHKLDSITSICGKHISLMSIPIPSFYSAHVPWSERLTVQNTSHFIDNFVNKMGAQEIFLASYPFNSSYKYPEVYPNYNTWTRIPNTLPVHTGLGTLARDTTPEGYDYWLQDYLDHTPYTYDAGYTGGPRYSVQEDPGNFGYAMRFGDAVSKATGKPFIFNPQVHIWFCRCGATGSEPPEITGEVQREPTNEELDLTANIAVSYGARGLIWFQYLSDSNSIGNEFYSRGIVDPWNWSVSPPRRLNIYGQEKWNKMISLTDRIKNKWGPTLMSFTDADRQSYIYRLERTECLSGTYLSDIVTYYPTTLPTQNCLEDAPEETPPLNWQYDCKAARYLQVTVFKKYDGSETPYFMIVNRRCSPHLDKTTIDRNGGLRDVRVKFDTDPGELTGFNEWVIKDVANPGWEKSFNKTQSLYVDLGEYMPGEGRLYYLVPKVKSGGTLIGNEYVTSGEEFTCEDTVWTNGYNLTIENGVNISFSDSAKFVVHGGTFQMGIPEHLGPNTINMDAAPNNSWKGFEFDTCNVKIYGVNFLGLANDSISMLTMIDCPLIDLRNNSFSLGFILQF
jgi:hypothetical protein